MLCRLDAVDALPRRRDAIDAIRSAQDFGDGEKNPNLITPEKYNELVKKHVMFKDMAADTYLASAGIADDWPYGRGCWQSDDKQCIVWFGEEDQLCSTVRKASRRPRLMWISAQAHYVHEARYQVKRGVRPAEEDARHH